jgi:hypothetical protein
MSIVPNLNHLYVVKINLAIYFLHIHLHLMEAKLFHHIHHTNYHSNQLHYIFQNL